MSLYFSKSKFVTACTSCNKYAWLDLNKPEEKSPVDEFAQSLIESGHKVGELAKEYFNADEKYPNTSDFIRRVVDITVKSIRQLTLMKLSYRTVKKGRSITHIVFKLNDWNPDEAEEILAKLRGEMRLDK